MKQKFKIGDIVEIKGCNVKIIGFNREKKRLRYECECLSCGAKFPKDATTIDKRFGCPCCGKGVKIVKKNVNSVWKTNPEIADLFANIEDSWDVSIGSRKERLFKCPFCGAEEVFPVKYITRLKSVPCKLCEDHISFGEVYMSCLLDILGVEYKREVSTRTLAWANGKRYDFYIEEFNAIIETHGVQHYKELEFKKHKRRRSLEEEQKNDKMKEALAKENGINHYIVIDCCESTNDYIKNSILNNEEFKKLFLKGKEIDWDSLNEMLRRHSKFKEVVDLWNSGETAISVIAEHTGLCRGTCRKYLKRAEKMGWCDYNAEESSRKVLKPSIKILCLETGKQYESICECARDMTNITGEKFYDTAIGAVVRGDMSHYKGFHFQKIEDIRISH